MAKITNKIKQGTETSPQSRIFGFISKLTAKFGYTLGQIGISEENFLKKVYVAWSWCNLVVVLLKEWQGNGKFEKPVQYGLGYFQNFLIKVYSKNAKNTYNHHCNDDKNNYKK